MTSKVFAPLIGEGVEELSIVEWKKKLGDSVDEGEALVEGSAAPEALLAAVAEEGFTASVVG